MTTSETAHRTTIILVRHGKVSNPNHVVYSDLPGFDLDPEGVLQAHGVASHLRSRTIERIVSSPLERARSTAAAIAFHHGFVPLIDERATEWNLSRGWVGVRWDDLDRAVPGQLEAYLADPDDLPFADEPLVAVARRMTAVVDDLAVEGGTTVFVSHQDPIAAFVCSQTGGSLSDLLREPPPHASATELRRSDDGWNLIETWVPTVPA